MQKKSSRITHLLYSILRSWVGFALVAPSIQPWSIQVWTVLEALPQKQTEGAAYEQMADVPSVR